MKCTLTVGRRGVNGEKRGTSVVLSTIKKKKGMHIDYLRMLRWWEIWADHMIQVSSNLKRRHVKNVAWVQSQHYHASMIEVIKEIPNDPCLMPMIVQHWPVKHEHLTLQVHIFALIRNSYVVEQRRSGFESLSLKMRGLTTEWPWPRT